MRTPEATIAAAIEACRRELLEASPTPALDARVLAGFALGMDASALIAYGENKIDRRLLERLAKLTARRKAGEPVAYLVGRKEFHGLRLFVDRRVLVPRPETELLVELIVRQWRGQRPEILDLGTGSGAIACALGVAIPDARILATDVSADALEVAEKNVDEFSLGDVVELAVGDLFERIPAGRRFDVIVANLPYVSTGDARSLDATVRDYEPPTSLLGGVDGLDVYRRMLAGVGMWLKAGGAIYMECGPSNALGLKALVRDAFPEADIEMVRDLANLERIVVVRLAAATS